MTGQFLLSHKDQILDLSRFSDENFGLTHYLTLITIISVLMLAIHKKIRGKEFYKENRKILSLIIVSNPTFIYLP